MTDAILEHHLVQMLSQLEYLRSQLDQPGKIGPAEVVHALSWMVERSAGFADQFVNTQQFAPRLAQGLVQLSEFRELVNLFQTQPTSWSSRLWSSLFSGAGQNAKMDRVGLYDHIKKQGLGMLRFYFEIFETAFMSEQSSQQWTQTFTEFLKDLTRLVEPITLKA